MVSALEALSGVSVASGSRERLEICLTTRIEPSQPPPSGLAMLTHTHSLMNSLAHALMNTRTPAKAF